MSIDWHKGIHIRPEAEEYQASIWWVYFVWQLLSMSLHFSDTYIDLILATLFVLRCPLIFHE